MKIFQKFLSLLVLFFCFFNFSSHTVSAEPKTRDECLTYITKTAQCNSSCSGLTQIGTCSDDTSGNILCCDKVYKEGDKCGTNDKGTCREYKGAGKTCASDETEVGSCVGGTTATLSCCMSPGSVPTDDTTCRAQEGTCSEDTGAVNGGCSSGKKIGECKSESSKKQNCCKSSSSITPTSPGSASLTYIPLENLPGFESEGGDFTGYFKNIYLLALWIVALSALFMLIVGGFLYLSSAGNTHLLGTAKKTIFGALIGLVIALISWLLLDTINSDLTNLKFSGLSGAIGGAGTSGSGASPGTPPSPGSGSGCGGAQTQSQVHCGDASQALSDALKCMVDKLGTKKMQLSSVSDDSGGKSVFAQCRDNYSKPLCEHAANSCHYGGKAKAEKSCAADISNSYTSNAGAASKGEIKAAARACAVPFINDEGNHVHISVSGCNCDGHS